MAWIKERPKRSLFWAVVHTLGSLRMAIFLLAVLLVMSAYGAFYESATSNKLAQAHVYKSPLFIIWVIALAVNLIAVTLTRWPWRAKHAPFIITHYGIVTILLGALVGIVHGLEGHVTLRKGDTTTRLTLKEKILFVEAPGASHFYTIPFDAEVRRVSPQNPFSVSLREAGLRITVDDYREKLIVREHLVADATRGIGPGVELELHSAFSGQTLPLTLLLDPAALGEVKRDIAGLMSVTLTPFFSPSAPGTQIVQRIPAREAWLTFAKAPGNPLVHTEDPVRSGWWARLETAEDGTRPRLSLRSPKGVEEVYPLEVLSQGPATLADGITVVTLKNFWRNMVMREGEPVEGPADAVNPAALFWIETTVLPDSAARPSLRVAAAPDGSVIYESQQNGVVTASGTARAGEEIALGWGGWTMRPVLAAPRALVNFVPEDTAADGMSGADTVPGIRVQVRTAELVSEPVWIAAGSSGRALLGGQIPVSIGYGFRTHRLPFEVKLVNFEVPRDEGTDSPADFMSTLQFTELHSGHSTQAVARMNNPASYPPQLWRQFVGNVYKFSQAGWDPEDLEKTSLQVLYDPGWLLKWVGSLMMCAGIFMMFYLKPYTRKKVQSAGASQAANAEPALAASAAPAVLASPGHVK